jgi:hypothetical protein
MCSLTSFNSKYFCLILGFWKKKSPFSTRTTCLVAFYSANSLKQQSTDRYVTPLGHIILIPSQPVFAISPECFMLSWEVTNTNFIVSNPQSTALEASMLTITPPVPYDIAEKLLSWG